MNIASGRGTMDQRTIVNDIVKHILVFKKLDTF